MLFWMMTISVLLGSILNLVWYKWIVLIAVTVLCWWVHGCCVIADIKTHASKLLKENLNKVFGCAPYKFEDKDAD